MLTLLVRRAVARLAAAAAIAIALLTSSSAFADEVFRVEYLNGAEGMVVPDEDLFGSAAAMVPGDEFAGVMTVRNSGDESVALWFWVDEGITPDEKALLAHIDLEIAEATEGETLYQGPLSSSDAADPIALGVYGPGDSAELSWTVSMPLHLGDDYQNAIAGITWIFAADEEIEDSSDRLPPTGGSHPAAGSNGGEGAGSAKSMWSDAAAVTSAESDASFKARDGLLAQTDDVLLLDGLLGAAVASMGLVVTSRCRRLWKASQGP